jgi:hypothetical protein
MSAIEDDYRRICDSVWALYQAQIEKEKPRKSKRKVLLPPPGRGRPVDVLVVGISPSQIGPIAYATERQAAEKLARDFEYINPSGKKGAKLQNHEYYDPLLQFVRRLDEEFGVWPQVARGEKSLLVEFTDALHVTTDHRVGADLLGVMNPGSETDPVCLKCKDILAAELAFYQPRVVVCNGRLPSKFVSEICTGKGFDRPVKETMLLETKFGCKVHFSGYLHGKWMDDFSRARLLREIAENTDFSKKSSEAKPGLGSWFRKEQKT